MENVEKKYTNVPEMGEVKKTELDQNDVFLIVNVEDKYRIALGEHWVTMKIFDKPEEAQAYINAKPYELLLNIAAVMAKFVYSELLNNK